MATARKKKVETVDVNSYSRLDLYCIWLHEYYTSLKNAGFSDEMCLGLLADKDTYPAWVEFKTPTKADILKHIEDEED